MSTSLATAFILRAFPATVISDSPTLNSGFSGLGQERLRGGVGRGGEGGDRFIHAYVKV